MGFMLNFDGENFEPIPETSAHTRISRLLSILEV